MAYSIKNHAFHYMISSEHAKFLNVMYKTLIECDTFRDIGIDIKRVMFSDSMAQYNPSIEKMKDHFADYFADPSTYDTGQECSDLLMNAIASYSGNECGDIEAPQLFSYLELFPQSYNITLTEY